MKTLFVSKPSIGSWLIRKFTWSDFSHVAIVLDDQVVHATFSKGVHVTPLVEFMAEYPHVEEVIIDLPDEEAAEKWILKQVGKPYDVTFILGFILRHDEWEKDDAWVCNELMEAAAIAGGKRRIRKYIGRVSPQISYMIL